MGLFKRGSGSALQDWAAAVGLNGWDFFHGDRSGVYWRDGEGDVLWLTQRSLRLPDLAEPEAVRAYCRELAAADGGGLIEATSTSSAEGPCLTCIYKQPLGAGFVFAGLVVIPREDGWVWMIAASERGTTGVREALVALRLFESGELTLESYESSWAQDPYDAA